MKRKINLSIVVLSFLAIITTMIFMTIAFNSMYTGQIKKDLKLVAVLLYENELVFDVSEEDMQTGDDALRITVIDPEGNVIADNMVDIQTMDNHGDRSEVAEATKSGEGMAKRRSETQGEDTYYYALRMDDGYILRVARDADSTLHYIKTIIPSMLLIAAVVFGVSIITAYLLTRRLIRLLQPDT